MRRILTSGITPRWRKVVRDLVQDRTRTALAVGAVAVGVFAVGMIASTRILLLAELNDGWETTEPADATLYMEGFGDDLVAMAERVPGVRAAEGRRGVWLRFAFEEDPAATGERVALAAGRDERGNERPAGRDAGAEADGSGAVGREGGAGSAQARGAEDAAAPRSEHETVWRDINLQAIGDFAAMRVSRIELVSGAWPPQDGDVLLERAALEHAGVRVGDELRVEAAGGKLRVLRVSGVVHDRRRANALLEQSAAGYVTRETMDALGYGVAYTELHLAVAPGAERAEVEGVAESVKQRVERGGLPVGWVQIPEPGEHPMDDTVSPVFLILGVLGGLATALSALLVVNTIMALLARQVRQIGIMKAVGARSEQLAAMYAGTVFAFGLLSLAIAVPLGVIGTRAFSAWLAGLLNVNAPPWALPLPVLAAQIAVALLVPVAAAAWPLALGARMPVRRALSEHGHGDRSVGSGRMDRALRRVPWLSRPQRLALRNAFRRKGRLALTLLTLALAGAIVISVFTVRSSLLNTLDGILAYWGHDVRVGFRDSHRADALVSEALGVPGVEAAEAWAFHGSRRLRPDGEESGDILIVGPAEGTVLIAPRLRAGRWLLPADERGVVINHELVSEEPDALGVGDEIVLVVGPREIAFRVVGVLETTRSGPRAYLNYEALGRLTGEVGRAGSVRVVTSRHDAAFQQGVGQALEQHFNAIGLGVDDMDVMASTRESTEYQFNILVSILLVMAALLGVVGALGLASTMSMNVLERTRELGVLRSLGAGHRTVFGLVVLEGLVIGAMSGLLGWIASVPLGRVFSAAVGVAFLEGPLDHRFSWGGAALWIGSSLTLAALASLAPAASAMRMSVREALQYE